MIARWDFSACRITPRDPWNTEVTHSLHPPSRGGSQRNFRQAKQQTVAETAIADAIATAKAKVKEIRGPMQRRAADAGEGAESEDVEEELSDFERKRLATIDENLAVLESMGLGPGGCPRHDGRLASPAAVREVMSQEQAAAIHASLPSRYKVRWGRLEGMGAPSDDPPPLD